MEKICKFTEKHLRWSLFWWSCRSVVCSSKRLRHRCLALVFKNFFNTIILRNIRWRLSVHNPPNKQFLFTFDSYYLKNSLIFLFEVNLVFYKSAAAEVKLLVQKVHEKHKMTITETALDQVIYYWSATWTKTTSLKDFPWLFKGGLNCLLKEERAPLLILKLMEIANVKINKPFFFVLKLSIHLFNIVTTLNIAWYKNSDPFAIQVNNPLLKASIKYRNHPSVVRIRKKGTVIS